MTRATAVAKDSVMGGHGEQREDNAKRRHGRGCINKARFALCLKTTAGIYSGREPGRASTGARARWAPLGDSTAGSSGPFSAERCQPSGAVKFQQDKAQWTGEWGVTCLEAKVFRWAQPFSDTSSHLGPACLWLQGLLLGLPLPSTLFQALLAKGGFCFCFC